MKAKPITVLFFALVLGAGGCATTAGGGSHATVAESESGVDPCRKAINDVTEFCSEENFDRSKCEDAKTRSRDLCI